MSEKLGKCNCRCAINHSGGGFHCYWVLNNPIKVDEVGIKKIESINKTLSEKLGGDPGTQDISRVLRIPATFNFKLKDNPREVKVIVKDGNKYDFQDFKGFIKEEESIKPKKIQNNLPSKRKEDEVKQISFTSIENLPIPEKIKSLIKNGNDGTYKSRSEADQAVILSLVSKGISASDIEHIFLNYPIGEKYLTHLDPDKYLKHNIYSAAKFTGLTDEEMQDPLFISGALTKINNKYSIDVVNFQEHMVKKYNLKYLEKETAFFKYNGNCYEYCTDTSLNNLCQQELKEHRKLFKQNVLKEFIHFSIGDKLIDNEKSRKDHVKFLTLQNGLFDLTDRTLIPHNADIFTTNLLPYKYDESAECPRFLQFLEEVFDGNEYKISFIQEAVGYAFYKSIPKPAVFFLVGEGSNGKSVFIDTITNLVGEENASNISLNRLSKEFYILMLLDKMINISSETPNTKSIDTDVIKAAVAGDLVTGRNPYKLPVKFRPYAKHFLAMNKKPNINDPSHGMWRRLYIIDFPRTFTEAEMDTQLTNKLKNELSGIFNWAIQGYTRLEKKNFIFTEDDSMKIAKQQYKNRSSSIDFFISNEIKNNKFSEMRALKEVYEQYRNFCVSEGYKYSEKKSELKDGIIRAGFIVEKSTKHANKVYVSGLTL